MNIYPRTILFPLVQTDCLHYVKVLVRMRWSDPCEGLSTEPVTWDAFCMLSNWKGF